MDNQHRKISGYRDLSQEEIDMVNAVKAAEKTLLGLVADVQNHVKNEERDAFNDRDSARMTRLNVAEPHRWAAIAKTHIQEGASALVRAITQPT